MTAAAIAAIAPIVAIAPIAANAAIVLIAANAAIVLVAANVANAVIARFSRVSQRRPQRRPLSQRWKLGKAMAAAGWSTATLSAEIWDTPAY